MGKSNQEILEKAIKKAIDNGFDGTRFWTVDFTPKGAAKAIYKYRNPPYEQVVFSHDFAKALWGGGFSCPLCGAVWPKDLIWCCDDRQTEDDKTPTWRYHLQMMVIAPDPIKYLGEHLEEKEKRKS